MNCTVSSLSKLVNVFDEKFEHQRENVRGFGFVSRRLRELNFKLSNVPFTVDRTEKFYSHFVTESKMIQRFCDEVKEADVVADVGGYHGVYGFLASGTGATSYIFEMTDENYKEILDTRSVNQDLDVVVEKKAVWSENGEVEAPESGTGQSSVGEGDNKVDAVTLDSYFEGRKDPDVLKIDVEGAEGHVLEGAEQLLERSKPKIFLEIHLNGRTEEFGYSKKLIDSYLMSKGYSVSKIQDRGSELLVFCE